MVSTFFPVKLVTQRRVSFFSFVFHFRGDCCRPSLKRVLLVRILFFPWTCYIWLRWMLYWVVKYWILRREYDEEARIFITRRRLKINESEWDYAGEDQQAKYLSQKLWINENYQVCSFS